MCRGTICRDPCNYRFGDIECGLLRFACFFAAGKIPLDAGWFSVITLPLSEAVLLNISGNDTAPSPIWRELGRNESRCRLRAPNGQLQAIVLIIICRTGYPRPYHLRCCSFVLSELADKELIGSRRRFPLIRFSASLASPP